MKNSSNEVSAGSAPAQKRSNFSGKLGYVLATAGSAVGLGNIWRFPYLAAKYGGGIFLVIYLILAVTFGYTMMTSEEALGRFTRKSPVGAFTRFGHSFGFKFGGWINAVIPMLIVPYYSVIGGWVTKYLVSYFVHSAKSVSGNSYFTSFISNAGSAELWFIVFCAIVVLTILGGVKNGVERVSKIMMPVLVVLAVIVAIYSMTRPGALAGVKYLLIPNIKHFSIMTIVAAMGQMFYSLSIAMGILYTYGSYMKKDVNVETATYQVVAFDSGIAILAGLMVIPAVFSFYGGKPSVLNAGPSLMFITLPKVFATMGLGRVVGVMFFLLVLFAAATSAISLAETSVSTFEDELGWSRARATIMIFVIMIVLGSLSSLGYSLLDSVRILGMQILDFFDFLTNSVMMPIAAMATCLLVIRAAGTKLIEQEVTLSSKFFMRKMYNVVIRFIAPIFLVIILISSILNVFGIVTI
ncbi:MAG: sodium-dependent transporter [Eubacterium sp.]|jgi:NSS family neurotransmitter:Na+ symporter|nr:sodium-dependent transporter [Eubacterium sp.]